MQTSLVFILLLFAHALSSDTTWIKARVPSKVRCISSAISSDGQYAVIGTSSSKILYSTNYGHTFVESTSPAKTWTGVSQAGTGNLAIAVSCDAAGEATFSGEIWRSVDFGVTWSPSIVVPACRAGVAMSYDGQYVVAIDEDGFIWYSSDRGRNFAQSSSPSGKWTAIDMDWTGQYAIALGVGTIRTPYFSTDFGVTWTRSSNGGEGSAALAINANGSFAIAGKSTGGDAMVSEDYGRTWRDGYHIGGDNVAALAVDRTGQLIIAGPPYFEITRSTNFGANWNYINPPSDVWMGFSLSANGTHALALTGKNFVYYSDDPFGRPSPPIASLVIFTVIISIVAGVILLLLFSLWMRKPRSVELEASSTLYTSAAVQEDGAGNAGMVSESAGVGATGTSGTRPPRVRLFNDFYGRYATAVAEVARAETSGENIEDGVVKIGSLDFAENACLHEDVAVVAVIAQQV